MLAVRWRPSWLIAPLLGTALAASGAAAGVPPSVMLNCERRPGKGRVLCEVEAEVVDGRIAWADVVVLSTPDFVKPLRARVGFRDASAHTDRRVRLPLALLATGFGDGRVSVKARAVVCRTVDGVEACIPETVVAEAVLRVGPIR
jgi:hypothetical protein